MAIQKTYLDPRGVSHAASYWRVAQLSVDLIAGKAEFTLLGYRDALARQQRLAPVGGVKITVDGAEFVAQYARTLSREKNLAEIIYDLAQARPEFAGGIAV